MLHPGNEKNLSMKETIVVSQDCPKFLGPPVTCGSQRCKVVLSERPPQPRYVFIWDIQTVLDFVKCQLSRCDLLDKVLT